MGDNDNSKAVSHGVSVGGYGLGGFGDNKHNGAGVEAAYTLGVPLVTGDSRLLLDPSIALNVGHFGKDYLTPGGEGANSAFTRYGLNLGLALRYVPPILDHRFWASLGARFGFGGFSTASSTAVSTPSGCVPGDFGRGECEPGAGPQTGNAGTTGLFDPRTGSSKGTSGAYMTFGIPLTLGFDVARGNWGNLSVFGGAEPTYTKLVPSGTEGFGYWGLAGFLGVRANFGGNAVEKAATPPPPAVETDQMSEVSSPTIAGNDAVDPVFDMTLANGKVTGTLDGTMTGPDGKPATFEFVDKEVKSYPATIRVKITQKPLTPGVYTLNYTITSADKTKKAQGVAKFTVSKEPTLKLDKFNVSPAEFYAGNKNVKIRIETSLKDGDKIKKLTLTFKKKKDDKDEIGTDVAIKPMTFESLTVGSKGMIELDKLDLSSLDGNNSYIITATVEGGDGQVKQINTSVNVKPKANLDVKGLGSAYVPGTIPPISLKLAGVDKIKVRVTVTTTLPAKDKTWNSPAVPESTVTDSQIVEITSAKEEKVSLRCQTADKKTVMIADGGKNAKTGNYEVTFEAVNDKGEVIQPLSEPKAFSVGTAAPTFTGGGKTKKSGS